MNSEKRDAEMRARIEEARGVPGKSSRDFTAAETFEHAYGFIGSSSLNDLAEMLECQPSLEAVTLCLQERFAFRNPDSVEEAIRSRFDGEGEHPN